MKTLRNIFRFTVDADWKQVGVLTLFLAPLLIASFWVPALATGSAQLAPAFGALRLCQGLFMGLLALWWLRKAVTATLNQYAAKRWGGRVARTENYIEIVFFLTTIAGEILQIFLGAGLWILFIDIYLLHMTDFPAGNKERAAGFLFYVSVWVFAGLSYRGFMRVWKASY